MMDLEQHNRVAKNLAIALDASELIETHISTIILSGDLAYKLKKPVDFGFLDYSTLSKRHEYSLEEVRINRKFAPKLYLGVVPITGSVEAPAINGEGKVLEYAVKMHRFSQADQLDNIVEACRLELGVMEQAAKIVARSHAAADPVQRQSDYGKPERVLAPMLENFELLETLTSEAGVAESVASLKAWTMNRYEQLKPLLQQRKLSGFIRECHGDLHLHNMALHDGELILFDAIEFNPFLNHIDVISDLSFLLMDLEFRGLHRHAHRLLTQYLEITGDYEGVRLLEFYKTYRAMVRAKVAALRLAQEMEDDERLRVIADVEKYIALALGYTEVKSPFLAITHGYSGSGKSTFAMMVVEEYGAVRIRSDVERMRLFEKGEEQGVERGIYTADATRITYEHLKTVAAMVMEGGYPVIVDATFLKAWQRKLFMEDAKTQSISFCLVSMECEVALMQERIKTRSEKGSDVSEADLEVLQMQLANAEALTDDEEQVALVVDCSNLATMREALGRIEACFSSQTV